MSAAEMQEAIQEPISGENGSNTDAEDVRLALEGDQDAYARLYRRYEGFVCGIAIRNTMFSQREDVLQMTFMRVFRFLDALKDPSDFKGWIANTAVNVCRSMHRRLDRQIEFSPAMQCALESSSNDAPLVTLLQGEAVHEVRRAVAQLPDTDMQKTAEHYYFAGQKIREIADIMHCPVGTIKSRLHCARVHLHEALHSLVTAD